MLSREQATHLQELLVELSLYVNDHFEVIDPDLLFELTSTHNLAQFGALRAIMDTVWENVDVIDLFVRDNPADLTPDDLEIILTWKDALPITAFYVGSEAGRDLYLVQDRLIASHACDPHDSAAALVEIVFLPFEGAIVDDFHGIAYGINFEASSPLDLEGAVARASEKGIIETAEAFVEFSRELNQARRDAELEELLAEAARKSQLNAGEDISPDGFHRGLLAGLSREERTRIGQDEAARISPADFDRIWGKRASKAAPGETLFDCLMSLNKEDIVSIARHAHSTRYSHLRKEELARKLSKELLEGVGEEGSALATLLGALPPAFLRQTRDLIENHNGRLALTAQQANEMRPLPLPHPPLTFLYRTDGGYKLVMAADVCKQLETLDFDRLLAQSEARDRALRTAGNATDAYGLISLEDAYEELALIDSDAVNFKEFEELVWVEGIDPYAPFDTWFHNGSTYLVHWAIGDAEAAFDLQNRLRDDIEKAYLSAYAQYDPDDESTDIELLQEAIRSNLDAAKEQFLTRSTQARKELVEERLYILESQSQLPRKHLYEFRRDGDVLEALFDLPAVDRLETYLNERIPDGEPDHFFAETTVEQMIMAVVQRNADLPMLLEIALARGLKDCDDTMDRLVGLLGNLRNTLPLWELNGWSATEQIEMATGQKLFVDDFGRPLKIGRNDPCPCGSGKKYKKCCGR